MIEIHDGHTFSSLIVKTMPAREPAHFDRSDGVKSVPASTRDSISAPVSLSTEDRRHAVSIVALGCDRSTAGKFLGLRRLEWEQMIAADATLAAELARAEARAEIHFMKCVHKAAEEVKNFRSSLWWLERVHPRAYGRGWASGATAELLEAVVDIIANNVQDEDAKQQIVEFLKALDSH